MQKKWIIFFISIIIIVSWMFFRNTYFDTDEWIYFVPARNSISMNQNVLEGSLWRIHSGTKKLEIVWNGSVSSFLKVEEYLYIQEPMSGIYRTRLDGSDPQLIYKGLTNAAALRKEGEWLYFSVLNDGELENNPESSKYLRYHMKTAEIEEFLCGTVTGTNFLHSTFVLYEDYFMTIANNGEKYGILAYDLSTEEYNFCTEIVTGRRAPFVSEESKRLYLTECGKYIILLYLDYSKSGYITGIYATEKEGLISDNTIWKEVRFTDMQKGTFYPPHIPIRQDDRYPIVEATYGYVFYDGYVFYQNEGWNLCSRPLFGREDEVIVYEGTALKEDQRGRVKELSCNLAFGDKNFYYQYYIEIDEMKAADPYNIQPEPIKWERYIRKLP